ncbi:nitrate reductase molybdenum cofactor assembly chaperone [Glycomyces dulcitolivorans]|uniref:nitrate reductase molybdenum cofactor assembly chaperone n=1 Tax=Glycomyces dulcitolivorans TaxID=2200759 RepID=UPI001E541EDA|nr:nitrate reductase molybdenum cofactor assembly chaperone [Glycomyces dulcitolivorans]
MNDVIRQAAAMLLCYPDQAFRDRLPLVKAAVEEQERSEANEALKAFCTYAAAKTDLELGEEYVRTFDLERRRALHLTYYTDGDTRRRGHALARIKEIYGACGWRLDAAELPDHLAVVLEFAARGNREEGERLLVRFQPGIELLRAALTGSPYAAVLDAVAATLPPPDEARREATRLAAAGPPAEDVGLDPYGRTPLGMPEKIGATK